MTELITAFINYINTSYKNALIVLFIGLAFYIVGKIYEGIENGGFQLFIAGSSKVIFFICIISSCSSLLFSVKGSFASSFEEYGTVCRNVSVEMIGGEENLRTINKAVSELGFESDSNITDIRKTTKTAKNIVLEISNKEMELLVSAGEQQ